ncbi:MAG: arginase, partial [Bacteroidota bacterium]
MSIVSLTPEEIQHLTKTRKGEAKIGDTIVPAHSSSWEQDVKNFKGNFCLIGIPEDIGPYANLGKRGAAGGFRDFLSFFLNMQDNPFLKGKDI